METSTRIKIRKLNNYAPNHKRAQQKQFKNIPAVNTLGEADSGPYSEDGAGVQYTIPL